MPWDRYLNLVWFWATRHMSSEDKKKLEDEFQELEAQEKIQKVAHAVENAVFVEPPTDAEKRRAAMERIRPKNWGTTETVYAQNMAVAQSLKSGG